MSLFWVPFQAQHTRAESTNPCIVIVMLIVNCNYPVPTYVKDVCVHHFTFCPIPGVSPTSLICDLWNSSTLITPSPMAMSTIGCRTAIFQGVSPWRFCFPAIVIGLVQINSQKSSTALNVSYIGTTKTFHFVQLACPSNC